jgi:cellulose synthase/poly-beta-1,6-N-acetylglucosamine synthase-like glycosyltransferase
MISIIITAYKEEKTIGKAIQSILDNNIKEKYEIIVLAPDEKTLAVARRFSNIRVKTMKDPGEGKPAALNMIFSKIKSDILVLTDGDVYVSKNAISDLLSKFEDKRVGAVTGRPISINNRKTLLGYWSHVLSNVAHERRLKSKRIKKRLFCSGYLYAFRNVLREIPTETLSEDGLISHMIYSEGYNIDYAPTAEVYVKYPTNFNDWIIQKKRSVGGYNQIKAWTGRRLRSFSKESSGVFDVMKYVKGLREFFYIIALLFSRVYLWFVIFIDINIKKKELKKIWLRAKSTK